MDIIDIMLAKALTPQGKTDAYVAKANAAAAKAAKAESDAQAAIDTVTAAATSIESAQTSASKLLEDAQAALETAQAAQINVPDTEDIDAEVKKLVVNTNVVDGTGAKTLQVISTYPDNTLNTQNITKLYKSTGANEDGTMTQKAISDAIAAIPTGGGSGGGNVNGNFTAEDAGHMVMVDDNGELVASVATEGAIVDALLQTGTYIARGAVGLDIDYANRTFTRIQEAVGKFQGNDFNSYSMYGGRTRCNVADDGYINAFYGDNSYTEDGSNGQVMVYQPKFYYKRIIRASENIAKGKVIRHETLILSPTEQSGFKLAPIFNGGLDYVLLPAFDASLINNKLASVGGVLPVNNITRDAAEAAAVARGTGWHIMNMAAESANQMLQMVEFGTMNGQQAIEQGITYIPSGTNGQCLFLTGSTSGNGIGHAASTPMDVNGTRTNQTTDGTRAINYRGMENPWGHLWSMIGGVKISGNGANGGGNILICKDFNYSGSNYGDVGFNLPSVYGWINAMGWGNDEYDWVYIPVECSTNANSLAPVGDYLWTVASLNGETVLVTGGSFGFKEECGPFYYGADRSVQESARHNYGVKLLYIPTKNSVYTANIAKWNTYMGG